MNDTRKLLKNGKTERKKSDEALAHVQHENIIIHRAIQIEQVLKKYTAMEKSGNKRRPI